MPTRPIGPGTCNLSVNVAKPLRLAVGRRAFAANLSMGDLVRRMLGRLDAIWTAAVGAASAAEADHKAAELLRHAMADGLQPEDAPAIAKAIELIEASERADRKLTIGLNLLAT